MNTRILALLATALLGACSPTADKPVDPPLAGARIGGPFALTDQDGRPRTDRDFAGKWRVMYFGYTFCPDVCPVDMQTIGQAMRLLEKSDPALAEKVVPIFVTVDPARDTPAVLKTFVAAFYPRAVGLTGTQPQIDALAKAYGVYHAIGKRSAGGYIVDHTRQAYLMGPQGQPIALLPQDGPPQALADEIAKWVK